MTPYVLLLTFALGNSHADFRSLTCGSWACVENIMSQAHSSQALTRLRVFDRPRVEHKFGEATVFPPLLDLRFQ